MSDDFRRALARVQADYTFYIDCQTRPEEALAGYDLTPDQRSTLADPDRLADMLNRGVRITISGTHDWVNSSAPKKEAVQGPGRDARVAEEIQAIRRAGTHDERADAVVRLLELVD